MDEQERGSIMAYMHAQFPMKIYDDVEVPENFETPSMYFPGTVILDANDTNMSFALLQSLHVKLFDKDRSTALTKAQKIANSIRQARMLIPLVAPAGEDTGMWVRITSINTRGIEDHAAQISIDWTSRYLYSREEVGAIADIEFNSEVKDND